MQALRFHAAKDLRIEDVPLPSDPAPDQVIIENRFCGICGTDLHEYAYGPIFIPKEPHPFTKASGPQVLGHEFAHLGSIAVAHTWAPTAARSRTVTHVETVS